MTDHKAIASHSQNRASNPDISAWVSANAGSGKTHVLVNRVIRLMLSGVPPEKILCLTYTRAAAAQMSTRLFERLAEWIAMDDETLIESIHTKTGHVRFKADELAEPRRLFARALETPGGLKVQTIHAFCEQLLHRFPVEAGITPGFEVLEDRQSAQLLEDEKARVLTAISQSGDADKIAALSRIVRNAGGIDGFNAILRNLLAKRAELEGLFSNPQLRENARQILAKHLGIDASMSDDDLIAHIARNFDRQAYQDNYEILRLDKTKTCQGQAETIWQMLHEQSADSFYMLFQKLVLNASGTPKAANTLCPKKFAEANPSVRQFLLEQQEIMLTILDKLNAIKVRDATDALIEIGGEIVSNYEAAKLAMGRHDYHDLILRTLAMFENLPDAAWVLYKLDGGIDHILVMRPRIQVRSNGRSSGFWLMISFPAWARAEISTAQYLLLVIANSQSTGFRVHHLTALMKCSGIFHLLPGNLKPYRFRYHSARWCRC